MADTCFDVGWSDYQRGEIRKWSAISSKIAMTIYWRGWRAAQAAAKESATEQVMK